MRVMIFTKRKLFMWSVLILSVLIGIATGIVLQQNISVSAQTKKLPIYSVYTDNNDISLTFDVAWGNSDLNDILAVLEKNKVKATFFITGEWVDKYSDDVKKIAAAGHEIQNHSNNHPHIKNITSNNLINDTKACDDKIEKLIGIKPTLYRAPYGEYSDDILYMFENSLGHKVIQWNIDSRDWKDNASVEKITNNILKHTKSGSIILFHVDSKKKCTVKALEETLPKLSAQGYKFIPVSGLLIKDEYIIDNNGVMMKR